MTTEPDPRTRPYSPRGAAEALFYEKAPQVMIEGPSGTGKTRALLEKINLCLMKYSGARGLIVRKSRESMTDSVLVTFEEKVIPEGSAILRGPTSAFRKSYRYPNSSTMVVRGLDKPGRIMSTEFDIIGLFEATEGFEDDWEKLTTRLRNGRMPYQQIIADCNPSSPNHWLNRRASAGKMVRLLSRHEDNPTVTAKYIETLDALTGARKERLRFGKWASQEGLVYSAFDRAVHVVPRFDIPAEWKRYRAIDFGYTNPFVCLWAAEDPDGRLYVYREIYRTRRIVEDHAKRIRDLSGGESYRFSVSDHDAEDRATLERHGVHTIPAKKDISPGIQAVEARLRVAGDGKPRLFYLEGSLVEPDESLREAKKAESILAEFDAYVWPKGADGKSEKEKPVDADNHGLDATRYLVVALDGAPRGARVLAKPAGW